MPRNQPTPRDREQTNSPRFGEVVEVHREESVDGDFNGNPELESLADTEKWQGVDALQGMEGRDAELPRETRSATEVLADAVTDRRRVLTERLDEAREVGLGSTFEAVIAATDPTAGETPVVSDDETLRNQLELIDGAIEQLERKSESD